MVTQIQFAHFDFPHQSAETCWKYLRRLPFSVFEPEFISIYAKMPNLDVSELNIVLAVLGWSKTHLEEFGFLAYIHQQAPSSSVMGSPR